VDSCIEMFVIFLLYVLLVNRMQTACRDERIMKKTAEKWELKRCMNMNWTVVSRLAMAITSREERDADYIVN